MKLSNKIKERLDKSINTQSISNKVAQRLGDVTDDERLRKRVVKQTGKGIKKELDKHKSKGIDEIEKKVNAELSKKGIDIDVSDDNVFTVGYKGQKVELTQQGIQNVVLENINQEITKIKDKHRKYIDGANRILQQIQGIRDEALNNTVLHSQLGLITKNGLLKDNLMTNPIFSGLGDYDVEQLNPIASNLISQLGVNKPKRSNKVDVIDVISSVKQSHSSNVFNSSNNCMRIVFYDLSNPHAVEMAQFGGKQAVEFLKHLPKGEKVEPRTVIKMPMPSNVQQGFSSSWDEYNNIFHSMMAHGFEGDGDPISIVQKIIETGKGMGLSDIAQITALPALMGGIAGGSVSEGASTAVDEAMQYLRAVGGMTINPMTSLTYVNHATRTHSFNWYLIPKSRDDWKVIKKAYYAFLSASYASNSEELSESSNAHKPNKNANDVHKNYGFIYRKTLFANVFFESLDEKPLKGLMNIPDCHLVDVSIEYSPNTRVFTLTDDDYPLGIKISVSFREKYGLNRHDYKYLKNGYSEITGESIGDRWQEYQELSTKSKSTLENLANSGALNRPTESADNSSNGSNNSAPAGNSAYTAENEKVADIAYRNAHNRSVKQCAKYVRTAVGLAPLPSAYQFGFPQTSSNLSSKGYKEIGSGIGGDSANSYQAQIGDIMVVNRGHGHAHGHISVYTKNGWVSDYRQGSKGHPYASPNEWKIFRR